MEYDGIELRGFQTLPTGELYDTILHHTLIGALADDAPERSSNGNGGATVVTEHPELFNDTVQRGFYSDQFFNNLFKARAAVLLEQLQPNEVSTFLSALLIGREFREATCAILDTDSSAAKTGLLDKSALTTQLQSITIRFIGEPALCELYSLAAVALGIESVVIADDTSASGFARLLNAGD